MKNDYELVKKICWDHNYQVMNGISTKKRRIIEDVMFYISKVNIEYAELIRKEFIDLDTKKLWSEDKYAKATFFRLKAKSVIMFLELYNNHVDQYK